MNDIENQEQDEEQQVSENSIGWEIADWIDSMLFAIFVVTLVFTFVFRQYVVEGPSMQNTLYGYNNQTGEGIGDRLIVNYLFYEPEQGDIVVAWCENLNEYIVKRIIAGPGQKIDIDFDTGIVYVDDKPLDEPYIKNRTTNDEGGQSYPVYLGEEEYFLMGDNRQQSRDSRSEIIGIVNREDIRGKAVFRIFPFDRFGGLYD